MDASLNNAVALVAQASPPAAGSAQPAQGGLNNSFLLIGALVVLFYFMIIRPQNRDKQRVADMRSGMKKGDRVRSIGGIYGTVTAVDTNKNTVKVKVDKNVELEFDKDAIATVIREDEAPAAAVPQPAEAAAK
jgi:preprotein translocase subunit YajC